MIFQKDVLELGMDFKWCYSATFDSFTTAWKTRNIRDSQNEVD